MMRVIEQLQGGLIVSCQAAVDSPLFGPEMMARMAQAAVAGGAVAIRARGMDDVRAIKEAVDVPVIGLTKRGHTGVYITPTVEDAVHLQEAGADLIAVDATLRPRPDGSSPAEHLARLHECLSVPVLADVDTVEAGLQAEQCGVAILASTLSGYTVPEESSGPDIRIIEELSTYGNVPVIAEGRYQSVEDIRLALSVGAWAVVIGGAITDPVAITRRFAEGFRRN
ncbi:MAG: N-acetylmannosamine-6-phosphate 2-epimerase [Propionibacteriaceae bacterium]|jgi:N-acylglucosamine-6-phosphate 2-epimerase|nr:N-acetylmannosamine-6-phosphate 2-epimerase [Propionibacteriaceae bacterium]